MMMLEEAYDNRNGTLTLTIRCWHCQRLYRVEVLKSQFLAWQNGQYIQNAMPNLEAEQRELLVSSTCSACWDELFEGDD